MERSTIGREAPLFSTKRGYAYLMLDALNKTSLDLIVSMRDDAHLPQDYLDRFPNVGFVFGIDLDGDTSPSSMTWYLRQARKEQNRHTFTGLWSTERVNEILSISNVPKWLREDLTQRVSAAPPSGLVQICYKAIDEEAMTILRSLVEEGFDKDAIALRPSNGEWFYDAERWPGNEQQQPTSMAKRWISKYEAGGGLAAIASHS